MAYTNLTPKNVGDPVLAEDYNAIDANFDDHEQRIGDIELEARKQIVFNFPIVGAIRGPTYTGLTYFRAPTNFVFTEAAITLFDMVYVYSGNIEIDVQKGSSADAASMSSIFLTKPSIFLNTAVSGDESTNAIFDPGQIAVSIGDWIRLDISEVPVDNVLGKFYVRLIGEI